MAAPSTLGTTSGTWLWRGATRKSSTCSLHLPLPTDLGLCLLPLFLSDIFFIILYVSILHGRQMCLHMISFLFFPIDGLYFFDLGLSSVDLTFRKEKQKNKDVYLMLV